MGAVDLDEVEAGRRGRSRSRGGSRRPPAGSRRVASARGVGQATRIGPAVRAAHARAVAVGRRAGRHRQLPAVEGLVGDPAGVPQLRGDQAAGLVDGVGDLAPAGDLLGAVDAGGVHVALALGADLGALGDQQPTAGALDVVVAHQVVGHVARRRGAHPGERGHEDAVGGADGAEGQGLEEMRARPPPTGVRPQDDSRAGSATLSLFASGPASLDQAAVDGGSTDRATSTRRDLEVESTGPRGRRRHRRRGGDEARRRARWAYAAPRGPCPGSTRSTASTARAAPGPTPHPATGTPPSSARTAPRPSPRRRPASCSTASSSPTHSVEDLAGRTDYWLGQQGRITEPVVLRAGRHPLRADLLGRRLRDDRRAPAAASTTPTRRSSTPRARPPTRRRSPTSCSCAPSAPTTCPTARTCATSPRARRSPRPSASARARSASRTSTRPS